MNFLYPGFLFSLLAVAIPILIHLFNFRKFKKVYFSNVSFLKAVTVQHSSREKLRNLLILACRVLAIIFLVLAFARPYWSSGSAGSPENGNLVNIYIDNSYSMEAVNKEGSLLDQAKRKAKTIAKQFQLNDKFQLTTNDFEGRHQRLVNAEELANLVDEVKVSPVERNLQQVINRQNAADAGKRNQYNYVISDFQQQFVGKSAIHTEKNNSLNLVRLNANTIPNVAVDSIWSFSPAHKPGDQEKFVVQLRNYSAEASTGIPLKLTINNQQKALATLNIPAGKAVRDTLSFSGLSAGWQKGMVSIKDFPVTFDDNLAFTFKVSTELKVLQITGENSGKYINALFGADPYFKLSTMPESAIVYAGFHPYNLIIIAGLKAPSSGLAQELKTYMKNGGTVVIFPDLEAGAAVYASFLQALAIPQTVSLSKDTVTVNTIALKNKVFNDVFEEIPAKLDLPKVNQRFIYSGNSNSGREDLMGLPLNQPFFSKYRSGSGQLYLCATSLATKDSNLPQHPVFVPLLYKIALTSVQEQPLYYTIGKSNYLISAPIALNPNQSLRLISGKQEVIPEVRQAPGQTLLYVADQIKTPGIYELYKTDALLSTYAFNQSRAESDLHYADDKALHAVFGSEKVNMTKPGDDSSWKAVENNHTELWKLCLVLCAVFLAVEALLIRFFNKLKI
ncbi:BatA domain-containing protein [Pedobacter cryoconitis]|uniref:Putative membrane protein (TIGR02226 family) n=1 Tax=Pedobacter cryoconitis TaxID=188932 RepID=A0A327SS27_9SPHI|nr:BatA domain-containing protein [Pedobacter cryoconitis]RAJ31709.1 putative membrane protein (TIGR02226 family) [Pedobacter cryoconitis]